MSCLHRIFRISPNLLHISFGNPKIFRLDLEFNANKLVGFNTTRAQNGMFYGSAFATGRINLYGPLDNLNLDIIAKTGWTTRDLIDGIELEHNNSNNLTPYCLYLTPKRSGYL